MQQLAPSPSQRGMSQYGLGRGPMIRITLQYIWALSESLEPISRLDPLKPIEKIDLMIAAFGAKQALDALIAGSVFATTLRSTRPLAADLRQQLEKATTGDVDHKVEMSDVWALKRSYDAFKIAFLAELGTFPAYFVSQKGSHDTLTLLENPSRMFPDDLAKKVPEAMFDVAEAGKALCYETPTACGFHLFRATESVLRRYYTHATGGKPQPKIRNIAVYVNAMKQQKAGDDKVLSVVAQLSSLHRNPLIHPDVILTMDEAIAILGMARSAITHMISQLPDQPPTTGAPTPQADPSKPERKTSQSKRRKPS